jgi:hypothetical protein
MQNMSDGFGAAKRLGLIIRGTQRRLRNRVVPEKNCHKAFVALAFFCTCSGCVTQVSDATVNHMMEKYAVAACTKQLENVKPYHRVASQLVIYMPSDPEWKEIHKSSLSGMDGRAADGFIIMQKTQLSCLAKGLEQSGSFECVKAVHVDDIHDYARRNGSDLVLMPFEGVGFKWTNAEGTQCSLVKASSDLPKDMPVFASFVQMINEDAERVIRYFALFKE